MRLAGRFLLIQAIWTLPLVALMPAVLALTGSEPLSAMRLVRWTGHAIGLAAFPAGITVAQALLERSAFRNTVPALALAAMASAFVVFLLIAFATPLLGDGARTLRELAQIMRAPGASWETRNDAAWVFYVTFFEAVYAVLFAAIGVQVGLWTRYAVPRVLHGVVYWATGLGLLLSGYAVFDTTYEAIVIRTAGDVSFAAFYTLMIPAGICAGLALPTLALLRGADIRGSSG
jgi:hypothetical protein